MGSFFSKRSKLPDSPQPSSPQADFLKALKKSGIKGKIREQGSIEYSFDTVPWNLRCYPKPLAVVYPLNSEEVSKVVKIAAKYDVPVQARSGGHSYGSYSLGGRDGALVVDLAEMSGVVVDQKTWRATIGGGTRLKEVTSGLLEQGKRTIAHGTCPQVGIGGHATVGGQGPLSRLYGLTLDHVVEAEVVLADGSIVTTNEKTNADLFFAIRGAGASFGIVTKFTVETHPAPETVTHYTFQIKYGSPDELAEVFLKWQEFISSPVVTKDPLYNCVISITNGLILIQGSRIGKLEELQASEIYVSLKVKFTVDVKTHELDWAGSILNWATTGLENLAGGLTLPMYMKSLSVRQDKLLTAEAVKAWFEYMHKHSPSDCLWVVLADLEGGHISEIPNDATAYSLRDCLYSMCAYSIGGVPYPDDGIAFLDGMIKSITTNMPDGKFGVYPGYVDPFLPKSQYPQLFWGGNYPRLLQIKKKYDPNNLFRNPQSVGADQPSPPKPAFRIENHKPVMNI